MLRSITIKQKIYFLAILGAFLAGYISYSSTSAIKAVGHKLKQIAEEDIPLTNNVSQITVHQLEQAIEFEKAVRYAQAAAYLEGNRQDNIKKYKKAKAHFKELAKQVDGEIIEGEEKAAEVIAYETEHHGSEEVIEEFEYVLKNLKMIENLHRDFDEHVYEIFALFDAGKAEAASKKVYDVVQEEKKLDDKLKYLLAELQSFTADAALKAEKLEHKMENKLFYLSTSSIVIFVGLALYIVNGIIRPLLATRQYAEALADGNLDIEAPSHNMKDEIADMMDSLSVFKEKSIEAQKMEERQKELEAQADMKRREAMMMMADDFDGSVGGVIGALAAAATELQATAESMKSISDETQQSSKEVASSSEQSSMSVNTVASAMEEMSATAAEISTQVTTTTAKSNDTAQNAQRANETVANLNELTESIGEVVGAIQDIADQTNLLALNATIEAARAGEAGKGFAVVADEVKSLATETSNKTEEINQKVTEIQSATRASVEAMERILSNISEIDVSVTGVSAAIEEQNATTNEIVRSVSEASQGAQQVSSIIGNVQNNAEETGNSAVAVLDAAREVAELSENLKGSVDSFLHGIRADASAEEDSSAVADQSNDNDESSESEEQAA